MLVDRFMCQQLSIIICTYNNFMVMKKKETKSRLAINTIAVFTDLIKKKKKIARYDMLYKIGESQVSYFFINYSTFRVQL